MGQAQSQSMPLDCRDCHLQGQSLQYGRGNGRGSVAIGGSNGQIPGVYGQGGIPGYVRGEGGSPGVNGGAIGGTPGEFGGYGTGQNGRDGILNGYNRGQERIPGSPVTGDRGGTVDVGRGGEAMPGGNGRGGERMPGGNGRGGERMPASFERGDGTPGQYLMPQVDHPEGAKLEKPIHPSLMPDQYPPGIYRPDQMRPSTNGVDQIQPTGPSRLHPYMNGKPIEQPEGMKPEKVVYPPVITDQQQPGAFRPDQMGGREVGIIKPGEHIPINGGVQLQPSIQNGAPHPPPQINGGIGQVQPTHGNGGRYTPAQPYPGIPSSTANGIHPPYRPDGVHTSQPQGPNGGWPSTVPSSQPQGWSQHGVLPPYPNGISGGKIR